MERTILKVFPALKGAIGRLNILDDHMVFVEGEKLYWGCWL